MADYDGIKEAQKGKKKMPLGMTLLFWGLVVFGLAYIYLFTPAFTGWTQMQQYDRAAQRAAAVQPATPAAPAGEARLAQGKAIYAAECAMCHGEKLEGSGAAPGLMGPKFIYGAALEDHIRVITKGTPNNMPAFDKQLGAEKIRNVALFIHSMHTH